MILSLILGAGWSRQTLAWPGLTAELPRNPVDSPFQPSVNDKLFARARHVAAWIGPVGFDCVGGEVRKGGAMFLHQQAQTMALNVVRVQNFKFLDSASLTNVHVRGGYTASIKALQGNTKVLVEATTLQRGDRAWILVFFWHATDPESKRTVQRVFNSLKWTVAL